MSNSSATVASLWARIALVCILSVSILSGAATASATPPQRLLLQSFSVATENGEVILRAAVDIDSRSGLRNMLRDGAQMLLTCQASLDRTRTLMPAETIATIIAEVNLRHDPLTREFVLTTSPDIPPRRDRDFDRLMDSTLARLRMALCPASLLVPGEEYTVTLKLALRHTEVPPWLAQTLFFWSWDVVPPSSFSQPFVF